MIAVPAGKGSQEKNPTGFFDLTAVAARQRLVREEFAADTTSRQKLISGFYNCFFWEKIYKPSRIISDCLTSMAGIDERERIVQVWWM